ncbi:TPA: hypothetical protein ACH3X2_005401 [Trebouxia sp. C0005]
MQQIGAEMNLSETAFVEPVRTEVNLCGHATMASAAVLFEEGNQQEVLHFETLSGRLSVRRDQAQKGLHLQMDFPACPATAALPPVVTKVKDKLKGCFMGVQTQDVLMSLDLKYVLVVLASDTTQQQLMDMQCDTRQLESLADKQNVFAVCVTCSGDGKPYHFFSRFFAPWAGIDEDPVTGSAHAMLGPYWAQHIDKFEKTLHARQCSERVGELQVSVDSEKARVTVAGQAVIVSKGEMYVPVNVRS